MNGPALNRRGVLAFTSNALSQAKIPKSLIVHKGDRKARIPSRFLYEILKTAVSLLNASVRLLNALT